MLVVLDVDEQRPLRGKEAKEKREHWDAIFRSGTAALALAFAATSAAVFGSTRRIAANPFLSFLCRSFS